MVALRRTRGALPEIPKLISAKPVEGTGWLTLASCIELPWQKQTMIERCSCSGGWGKYLRYGNSKLRARIDAATRIQGRPLRETVVKDLCNAIAEKKNRI